MTLHFARFEKSRSAQLTADRQKTSSCSKNITHINFALAVSSSYQLYHCSFVNYLGSSSEARSSTSLPAIFVYLCSTSLFPSRADHTRAAWFCVICHRPLQKRERTGKDYGCFPFLWKTEIFKWKINYILESLPRIEVFGGGKWQNGSSTNITQNREFVWIG